jgi:hypothetical protein
MAESETTEELTPPNAGFSAQDDLAALWFKAYQGEVTGEILFATVAEGLKDPEHRRKMEILSLLEARTKEACVPALDRNGLSSAPDTQTVRDAMALGEALISIDWLDFLATFEAITTEFLALYERIGQVSPADKVEAELLVAHEIALREFARRELEGRTEDSLALIEALPHMN